MMLASLISNLLLIPVLERSPGRKLVRLTVGVSAVLFALWLAVPWLWVKICLIILIKLVGMGWYEVQQGEAFASAPGRPGKVIAINSFIGVLGGGISTLVGWVADRAGLPAAMWLLIIRPVSLAIFTPRQQPAFIDSRGHEH